ncbi:mitochondrial coenzyme A diphosphatase NUDT8-like [Mytilus trossulus]|uniref:mitochondrial coenzyme A diphosphatase NUDT8-like n=1 Tax=Mytilus trossulus TaxID=6551 RepID=UPI0030058C61
MRLLTHKWTCALCQCSSFISENLPARHISSSANVSLKNVFSDDNKTAVQKKLSTYTNKIPEKFKKKGARNASVLIPLCTVNGEPSLLFMVRPMTMAQHRGEVCFPGGKEDDGDRDLIHTALRESHEEIGLLEDNIDIWGQMMPAPSNRDGSLNVVPIIGHCGEIDLSSLHLNKDEATSVFTRSIDSLCNSVHSTQFRRDIKSVEGYTLPVYTGGQHRIWGLTAIFVHQLLGLIVPELYHFKLRHR